MSILIAIILGIMQGLCEFLPVSSSGHLVLLQTIFGIEEGTLFLDTMLHCGTLVAVFAVYYKQIWGIIRHPIQKKTLMLIIATLVTGIIYVLFKDFFENAFGGGLLAFGFILTSIVLTLCDKLAKRGKSVDKMSGISAAGIGFMQGIAILPGLSRSGSTIAGARLFGINKEDAAEFSFLLSIPAILGSLVTQIPDVIREGIVGTSWGAIIVGTIFAAISGYFAIKFMLNLVLKGSFKGFAIYTLVLGILVLLDQIAFNIFFANPFVG